MEAPVAPQKLPAQPTHFIGREQELDALCTLVLRDGVRLVTLTGPGGTGKTRLALETAASLASGGRLPKQAGQTAALHPPSRTTHFRDGVFFVPLASISEPELVATTMAHLLGVADMGSKERSITDSLKAFLRDRHLLLLLDNFEQVLGAAELVRELIADTAHLKIIATSRERLHLRGEHEFPVPPLELPRTRPLPPWESLSDNEAVRLFVERAAALRPDFRLDDHNARYVAEICSRLDGLPLAIELAAARIKILTPEAILARLGRRLKLLTGGERDLPERHQTLRNAIGWSYDLLSAVDKTLFRRLSVFSGGGSLEGIEAVCAAPVEEERHDGAEPEFDALDGVSSLVDKNLLRQEPGVGSDPRFSMLETIGEYAREKLEESGELERLRARHASYFLALAESAEPDLTGQAQLQRLAQLEAEHDNMRAVLRWAVDGEQIEIALRLGAALHQFWKMRGYLTEGRNWLENTLAMRPANESVAPTSWRAKALMAAGTLASSQGDFVRARAALEESLGIFRALGDKESVASTLRNLGNELRYRGDLEGSWHAMQEALVIARELGKEWDIAALLGDLGIVAQTLGNVDTARELYEESLILHRQTSHTRGIAMMLVNLGEISRAEGDYDNAGNLYTEALGLARELGDKWGVGMILHNLGHVAYHRRDYIHAWNLFTESLNIFYELRNKRDIAYCIAALAGLYGARRHPERAAVLFSAAQALTNTISSHLDPADLIEYERNLSAAQAQMSQADWDRAWVKGQALTLDEAVAFALQGPPVLEQTNPLRFPRTGPLSFPTTPLGESPGELTEREIDVLRLVASGLSDAQVADNLAISPRTVQRHLSSIYSKLGVTSRTAAARVAIERELV